MVYFRKHDNKHDADTPRIRWGECERQGQMKDDKHDADTPQISADYHSTTIPPPDVAAIFARFGIDSPRIVATRRVVTPLHDAVYLTLRGRDKASDLVKTFSDRKDFEEDGPFRYVTAASVPPRLPLGSSPMRHVSRRKVRVSWLRPFSQVWLHFENEETATRAFFSWNDDSLEPRDSSVGGPRLHVFKPPGCEGKFLVSWQIGLSSGRRDLSSAEIRSLFSTEYQPTRIKIKPGAANKFDEEAAPDAVMRLMTPFGGDGGRPRDSWNHNDRTYMDFIFKGEDEARRAVQQLRATEREFLGGQTMQMDIVHSAQIQVLTDVYDAMEGDVQEILPKSTKVLSMTANSGKTADGRFTHIKVTGMKEDEVAGTMGKIEEVVAGRMIKDRVHRDARPFWNTLLMETKVAKMIEKEMEDTHGVLIKTNKFRREMRYFGPGSLFADVEMDLVELVTTTTRETFCYHLNREEFLWMRREGFEILKSAIGNEVVFFDPKIKPHVVTVIGSGWQYREILTMISQHMSSVVASPTDCIICECEAEGPINLPCGHRYCTFCFENMCLSAAGPITCNATATCDTVLDLHFIEDNLSSIDFESVLQVSFATYIAKNRPLFRPCPTPECQNLYEPTTAISTRETCVQCLLQTCTLCHGQHPTSPCPVEAGLQTEDQMALKAWKENEDVKDCPACGSPIEKDGGCNHIFCLHCKSHICWNCLKIFPTSGECYDHLDLVHGGNGLVAVLDQDLVAEDAEARAELELNRLLDAARGIV
ncbi:unnamed protein product [Zymoseptoria tritici ST99CH_1E4]|uniref:RBR-type E3 ubiquitin transferase n=1 Tax=Zymoseptoria tritici ST99CH_1E4 TaxID=1276532 RepID=A0A2H1GY65_ZYMTR|nr:unnamed protein product [Zymoseptoria tritici ST99CH_1E4]